MMFCDLLCLFLRVPLPSEVLQRLPTASFLLQCPGSAAVSLDAPRAACASIPCSQCCLQHPSRSPSTMLQGGNCFCKKHRGCSCHLTFPPFPLNTSCPPPAAGAGCPVGQSLDVTEEPGEVPTTAPCELLRQEGVFPRLVEDGDLQDTDK